MTSIEKKKIKDLASRYEVPSELLIRLLRDNGVKVLSHLTEIDQATFFSIKDKVLAEKEKLGKTHATKSSGIRKNTKTKSKEAPKSTLKGSAKLAKATLKKKAAIKKPVKKVESETPKPVEQPVVEDAKIEEVSAKSVEQTKVEQPKAEEPKIETPKVEETRVEQTKSESSVAEPEKKTDVAEEKTEVSEGTSASETKQEDSSAKEIKKEEVATDQVNEKLEVAEKPVEKSDKQSAEKTSEKASGKKASRGGKKYNKKAEGGVYQPSKSELKVTIEKPDAAMQARIEKYNQNQAERRRSGKSGGVGYTGTFGKRAPRGDDRSKSGGGRGPGGSGSQGFRGGNSGARPGGPSRGGVGGANHLGGGLGAKPGMGGGAGKFAGGPPAGGPGGLFGGKGGVPPTGGPGATGRRKKKKKRVEKKTREEEFDVRQNVNRVMASLGKTTPHKTHKKEESGEDVVEEKKILEVGDLVTVGELAGQMEMMPNQVIAKCMELGLMVTINYRLDFETITLIADEFGFEAKLMEEYEEEVVDNDAKIEVSESAVSRPPVVTVMGHVDHGKTSILDWVRKSHVTDSESGGITQHIGAYVVSTPHGKVTFLDTPGHEAFSSMRARGSQSTDVVVLVVAADSHVMPQTIESIEHAKAAKVPIIVAINKCDLETSNPDRIRGQLAEHGVEVEQWGGNTSCVEVSAKTGKNMDKLLELLALESEVLELKADPDVNAKGVVIEARIDQRKGVIATVLVQNGTLRVGDSFVMGIHSGKVRAMLNDKGEKLQEAGPSTPVQILGIDGAPQSGDAFMGMANEKEARDLSERRSAAAKDRELMSRKHMSLELMHSRVKSGEFSEFNLIIKADVDGSVEAIASSLEKLSNKEVKVNIIRKSVGAVNESDVLLASASNAVILAFHVLPNAQVRALAESEGVEIKLYRVIYEIIEEVQGVLEGMLKPSVKEEVVGEAEIRQIFKISKIGLIAGSFVHSGTVDLHSKLRIYRNGVEVGVASVTSLKRNKDDVEQVKSGLECGIGLENTKDIRVGDTLAFFRVVEVARHLDDVAS